MACQKVCEQGRGMHKSKGQHIGKAPLHAWNMHHFASWCP